ncbi:uncharacterized protein [Triticum aestivum]|uniref:uncharacterized protein n=1 Tax=Triticum aestivum TaxID=4565 RepID=UPI001D009D67|nr:uncharacterized protein LOC123039706 [Triticum aestivum]
MSNVSVSRDPTMDVALFPSFSDHLVHNAAVAAVRTIGGKSQALHYRAVGGRKGRGREELMIGVSRERIRRQTQGEQSEAGATARPSKHTATASSPRYASLHLQGKKKELACMVFTKKKNLLKDWMWAVRGHELVPGIQKGGRAMELREDG